MALKAKGLVTGAVVSAPGGKGPRDGFCLSVPVLTESSIRV